MFDVWYLVVVAVTIAIYTWFTFTVTEMRVKQRKMMNEQDTDANQKAIDSLLNFETVKYFGAERREAERYDGAMAGYAAAALKTELFAGLPELRPGAADHRRPGHRHGDGGDGRVSRAR